MHYTVYNVKDKRKVATCPALLEAKLMMIEDIILTNRHYQLHLKYGVTQDTFWHYFYLHERIDDDCLNYELLGFYHYRIVEED